MNLSSRFRRKPRMGKSVKKSENFKFETIPSSFFFIVNFKS